jgi:hypothetical protein
MTNHYNRFINLYLTRVQVKEITSALLEPLIFHPITVYFAILGNIHFLRGKKSWGEMTRKGFNSTNVDPDPEILAVE